MMEKGTFETLQENKKPIAENEAFVSYLGVVLEKAGKSESAPQRAQYENYINDEFTLELQKKIAIAWLQGEPVMIEGGTSIGKTTTVKKMAAEAGYEVHYANLNGATDVEDLMGRYIPNPNRKSELDPEYVFADGKVTSGLRVEEGKIKVIILDEYNTTSPNILIRLHEVLDALERNGSVTLSEDASEVVSVDKSKTKIVALTNTPGKGYLQREPLDPAQLRRWVYQKEQANLPKESFRFATETMFGVGKEMAFKNEYLFSRKETLSVKELSEIPGMEVMVKNYQEFHESAKQLLEKRRIAANQPQNFTFDDREEPRRVRDFVARFYRGDINKTFQEALRYYYVGKVLDKTDKQQLEELIKHVAYKEQQSTKRVGLEDLKIYTTTREAFRIMGNSFYGSKEIEKKTGEKVENVPQIPFTKEELAKAKESGKVLKLEVSEDKSIPYIWKLE